MSESTGNLATNSENSVTDNSVNSASNVDTNTSNIATSNINTNTSSPNGEKQNRSSKEDPKCGKRPKR